MTKTRQMLLSPSYESCCERSPEVTIGIDSLGPAEEQDRGFHNRMTPRSKRHPGEKQ